MATDEDVKQQAAKWGVNFTTVVDVAVKLSVGGSVSFAPDPRSALKSEWTVVFVVKPGWKPAAGAKADWGPPLP